MANSRFLFAVLCVILLAGCGGKSSEKELTVIRIGNGGEPRDLDPHIVTGNPEVKIISTLLEGLVTWHPSDDNIPCPGVAERWECSPDGRTWRFFLRENGRWSNGDPVTAQDFIYSWRRVLQPELGNEYADLLYFIRGAEAYNKGESKDASQIGLYADSNYVFRIELVDPVADFFKVIVAHPFLPVHPATIEKYGGPGIRHSGWTRPENYVGNGPYRLVKWEPDSVIRVERNPFYWDADNVLTDAFEFYPFSDENTELRAFESRQLHVTTSCPVNMREFYREKYPDRIRFDPYGGIYYYMINTTRRPLDDLRIRQALALAIDKEQIIRNLLKGRERVANTYLPDGLGNYKPDPREGYNPQRARLLLAEAGYPGGKGFPSLEILYNTSESHAKIAEAIQSMWSEALGISIRLTNTEWKVYLDLTEEMDYDIARAGWIGISYISAFLRPMLSYSPNNGTGFNDPEYDRLVEKAMHTMDEKENLDLIREAENRLLDAQPIIPLYWYTNVYLIDSRIKNWNPKMNGLRPMKLVYLED